MSSLEMRLPAHSQNNSSQKTRGLMVTALFGVILIIAIALGLRSPGGFTIPSFPSDEATPLPGENQGLPGWLAVYFTDPNPPDNLGQSVIDRYVQPAIAAATTSIDATSFDLNLPDLVNALAGASLRGVKVRVVYDGTNGNLELENAATGNKLFNTIKLLKASGVSLVDGGRLDGLMHDKMIIIDGKTLFVGSWNLSYNDTYRNNNNLLKITNPNIIANYQAKFEELFVDRRFGASARVKVPNPSVTIDGVRVENYFAPEDEVTARLLGLIQQAKKSVHFMVYTYTDKDLAAAMISKARAGLDVQGVIESRGADQGALASLYCADLPVRTDGNRYTMHHKVMIIDGQMVITGSFNFTKAANEVNDDNVIVIHSPDVAALYEQEYQRMMSAGKTPQSANVSCKK
jgi:phosphatidylserine/phosphatidylglycerophosphate/cardiolipin synthase-like enzyme